MTRCAKLTESLLIFPNDQTGLQRTILVPIDRHRDLYNFENSRKF